MYKRPSLVNANLEIFFNFQIFSAKLKADDESGSRVYGQRQKTETR